MEYDQVEDLLANFGGDSRFDPPTDRAATPQEDAGEAEACPSECEDEVAELKWLREYANPRGSTIEVRSSATVKPPEMASNKVVNERDTCPANALPAPVLQEHEDTKIETGQATSTAGQDAAHDENIASAVQGQQAIDIDITVGQAGPIREDRDAKLDTGLVTGAVCQNVGQAEDVGRANANQEHKVTTIGTNPVTDSTGQYVSHDGNIN